MDKDIADEVGKIAALVARLKGDYVLRYGSGLIDVDRIDDTCVGPEWSSIGHINITKTRKSRRIPMLRALADKLRAELKEQKK